MVTVALAGATTGFGLTVLKTFLHLNSSLNPAQQHKIILLSRSSQPEWSAKGLEVRQTSYEDHAQLVSALQGVHTLISLIGGDASALRNAQASLLAAARAADVKRFAPSEYAGLGYEGIDLYAASKAEIWKRCLAAKHETGMQVARFNCGLFMSILATGTTKGITEVGRREDAETGEEEALAGLRPWNFVLNLRAGTADLPGDGSAKVAWTEMRDVATFMFHALSLPLWPEDLNMRGDLRSFREVLEIVQRVQGRKFLVRENSIEEMEDLAHEEGKQFYNQVRVALVKGYCDVPDDLNRMFPDVHPIDCESFVKKWWSGTRLPEAAWEEDQAFM
ncbi:hypothetical protein KC332_g434 [Hortaea werneckii]|uniref:NmrA-like domain-containing protein n=2 Tax=Hortaea werneckii TaxID=91943 RepID=A0A3M7IHC3_HORWE|nr:hypothetical protein KC358_g10265 [Hortaea werneckii]OTA24932.1 hypothetical protein BTJ68_12307 [Hortaea werneckii EXF-2000]KAI6827255.1 hypothetical protein KC350_g8341 [Hortaea werneckii]KAI6945262.1 hypothetical protein KC341_g236 [Hortaea werneckii]KAI6948530.1 hypothetical protein KC348_g1868 [Hortaea werneckii]